MYAGPIRTRYSEAAPPVVLACLYCHDRFDDVCRDILRPIEVFWTKLPSVALPADVIAKYNDRVMALTGHEVKWLCSDDHSLLCNSCRIPPNR